MVLMIRNNTPIKAKLMLACPYMVLSHKIIFKKSKIGCVLVDMTLAPTTVLQPMEYSQPRVNWLVF